LKQRIDAYITMWENRCYSDGIPDDAPARLVQLGKVPSYKQIAMAILRNDVALKSLGCQPVASEWYSILKRIEIDDRGGDRQLTFDFR
jgi:predicted phosphoadenosine phosphosulfate sulfurtransferase